MPRDDSRDFSEAGRRRELSFLSNLSGETGYSTPTLSIDGKRSPSTKSYLLDMKCKLVEELKIVEKELDNMEFEKSLLCNFRTVILQYHTLLVDAEQNKTGKFVPERVKVIIENFLDDVTVQEANVKKGGNIPFLDEICKQIQNLKESIDNLLQCMRLFPMDRVEDFLCECGLLFGMIDCILLYFYDEALKVERLNGSVSEEPNDICQGSVLESQTSFDDENIELINEVSLLKKPISQISFERNDSILSHDGDNSGLSSIAKDIKQMTKILKTIDRISSGKPKFKVLVSKFQEINIMLKEPKYDEICEQHPAILRDNYLQLFNVASNKKVGQSELSNARFLLSQFDGRVKILKRL